jgi:putative ABC transport system permease protein
MEPGVKRRLASGLLRVVARVVPRRDREAWLQEWHAEIAHRREIRLRHVLGSFFDAAWLRRQFTRDAEFVQDVRHGVRVLRSSPAFAVTAILALALGIGATVGIFSVVDTLLVRRLPFVAAERVAMLWQGEPDNPATRGVSPGVCYDWQERLRAFEAVACAMPWSFDYTGGAEPVVIEAAAVTERFFSIIGTNMFLGRAFARAEHLPEGNRVVVISHRLWRREFGAAPGVVGTNVVLDREPYFVAGVLPASFQPRLHQSDNQTDNDPDIYFPLVANAEERQFRGAGSWNAVGRLKPGVTMEQAQADLDRVSRDLAREFPRTDAALSPRVQPLREHLAGNLAPALRLLLASVIVVLLIASANVANLLLARTRGRTRELAIRSAIGAARGRLVRQMLTESLLIASLGTLIGLGVAWATIRTIIVLSPGSIRSLSSVVIDGRVLAFATMLTVAVAVLVGLLPALLTSGVRLVRALRGIAIEEVAGRRHSLRSGIVVAEIALAVLLLAGAALLLRSFGALLSTDPGFNPDRLVALQVFAWTRNGTPERRALFVQEVLRRMEADPLVTGVGAVSAMPFIEADIDIEVPFVAGAPLPSDNAGSMPASLTFVSPGYLPTMGVPMTSGRGFADADRIGTRPVAMVSEKLARTAFGGRSPIGRMATFRYQGKPRAVEVVGVFADIRHDGLDRPPRPELLVPHAQYGYGGMTFVARAAGPPADALTALKAHIRAVDPAQAIFRSATVEELVALSLVERRFILTLLGAFALLAAVLAVIGIYGVMSVTTAQRAREFGVRLALGAGRGEILGLVLKQGAVITGLGLGIGLAGTLAFDGLLTRFLYAIKPGDPLTLAIAVSVLAAAAALACLLPARRATRSDSLVILRAE